MDDKTDKVIRAAETVFLRYGYQRTTMGDIALAAGLSRPALYLVYPSKAEIFAVVLDRVFARWLGEVRARLDPAASLDLRMRQAFEIWCVRPFETVLATPDARDLLESGRTFAAAVVERNFEAFERLLAQQLAPRVRAQTRLRLPAIQIARLLVGATLGFKQSARDAPQLRQMIAGSIAIALAALEPS